MFRSIRWTLLFWYTLILAGALAMFGLVLHAEMERTLYRDADARIDFWMSTVLHKMKEYPADVLEGKLRSSLPDDAFFQVGDNIRSGPEPKQLREKEAVGPDEIRVRVGMDVQAEHDRIRAFLNMVLLSGAGILVLALAGGWVLVSRSLRPIDRMSGSAERISAANLAERIDTDAIKNELGRLAATLNNTFDRLQKSFDRQTEFTADASHELRTPLSILLSHLELSQANDKTPEQFEARVETCIQAARRMKSVVEGLLTLARIDAGELNLEKADVNFGELVKETSSSLSPLASERKVRVDVQAEEVSVSGDRERLRELVGNLISNAIRYNRDGGSVDVSLAREGEEAVLRVADTGIGIPEEERGKVFDRFYRLDKARSREAGGSGLGLAITRWIAEAHGGTVTVTGRDGEGSEFIVRLPVPS